MRGEVSLYLDARELEVRGAFRATIPLARANDVRADGPVLRVRIDGDDLAFELGVDGARRWAAAIAKPAPALARKLGIDPATSRLRLLGRRCDVDELAAALAGAACDERDPTLVIVRADTLAPRRRSASTTSGRACDAPASSIRRSRPCRSA